MGQYCLSTTSTTLITKSSLIMGKYWLISITVISISIYTITIPGRCTDGNSTIRCSWWYALVWTAINGRISTSRLIWSTSTRRLWINASIIWIATITRRIWIDACSIRNATITGCPRINAPTIWLTLTT